MLVLPYGYPTIQFEYDDATNRNANDAISKAEIRANVLIESGLMKNRYEICHALDKD